MLLEKLNAEHVGSFAGNHYRWICMGSNKAGVERQRPETKPMNFRQLTTVLVSVLLLTLTLQAQDAQETQDTQTTQDTSKTQESNVDVFKAVSLLLFLAIVIESALAIIFSWRPFVGTFNARAIRPLISFVVSYLFVETFELDLMTTIVDSMTNAHHATSLSGKILTALVLAGGSAGVNNLLVALGYRQKRTPETETPKPPPTQAWIAIRLARQRAIGQVQVFVGTPPAAGQRPPLVGIIHGTSKPGIRYFLSDPGRFPGYGGHCCSR